MAPFPTPLQAVPTKGTNPVHTPSKIKISRPVTITQLQKEVLVEDLQQELSERARRLRAQYALQAANLRTRLEYRVERIPVALRKAKLVDLLEKHAPRPVDPAPAASMKAMSEQQSVTSTTRSPTKLSAQPMQSPAKVIPVPSQPRNAKRASVEMEDTNKENASLSNPRKRQKAEQRPSRQVPISQILSPKSNNSRQLPPLAVKAFVSPLKSNPARPISPSKAMPTVTVAPTASSLAKTTNTNKPKAATVRVPSKQAVTTMISKAATLRGRPDATAQAKAKEQNEARPSDASNGTNGSTGTTIVKSKSKAPTKKTTQTTKVTKAGITSKVTNLTSARSRKATESKTVTTVALAAPTGRTLRKRM